MALLILRLLLVTSLAEVWIETTKKGGLQAEWLVTSLAEVWIETSFRVVSVLDAVSLPLRKCGLKQVAGFSDRRWRASLPLRKCGLKL